MKKFRFLLLFLIFGMINFSSSVFASEGDVNQVLAIPTGETTFTIKVDEINPSSGITGLYASVWGAVGSTDDAKDYPLSQNGDGSYSVSVDISSHTVKNNEKVFYDRGLYYIDIKRQDNNELLDESWIIFNGDANEWERYIWNGSNFQTATYRAVLSVDPIIEKGTIEANAGEDFKSGYGYKLSLNSKVASNTNVNPQKYLSGVGSAFTYFSEFNFKEGVTQLDAFDQYNRQSQRTDQKYYDSTAEATLEFKENSFSANNSRVHFTPLWYPDGKYTIYTESFDAWTPGGMLSLTKSADFNMNGNVYDDWQVNEKR